MRYCGEGVEDSLGESSRVEWDIDIHGEHIGLKSCPKPMITEESEELITMYGHYKNRLLPLAGGILNQPAAYQRAMLVIDARLDKIKRESSGR